MTAAIEPRRPVELARVVVIAPDAWQTFTGWVETLGLTLKQVPTSPAQHPRYRLSGEQRHDAGNLTEREFQVLGRMAAGMSNGEIGRALHLSEDTIKTHARRLFRRLGVRDRAHAVARGYETGLLGSSAGAQ